MKKDDFGDEGENWMFCVVVYTKYHIYRSSDGWRETC